MTEMENYWKGAKKITGAANAKTEKVIGVPGAWTLKQRGGAKIFVGAVLLEKSDFHEMKIMDETGKKLAVHGAVCEHGRVQGASTRKVAIAECKKSALWCEHCAARVAAL